LTINARSGVAGYEEQKQQDKKAEKKNAFSHQSIPHNSLQNPPACRMAHARVVVCASVLQSASAVNLCLCACECV
jgi:hypothetical protein